MQWTDEQIGDIRKLASEGFTRRETADKLGTPKPNDPYEIKNGFTTGKHLLYAFVYDDERLRCTYELS